jgi:hypothetical protein
VRYVEFAAFVPSQAWRDRANAATTELASKGTPEERLAFIKSRAQVWRDLRQELTDRFGSRCWFTDAEETVAHLDIEHFRPKAEALDEDGTSHEGYWWLAFELSNLRLAGQIPNRQHKRCYFPLLSGSARANSQNRRWQEERPLFLDPTKLTDVELVAFDETGCMRASASAISDEDKHRVDVTNSLFGLSAHQPLIEARQRVWSTCRGIIDEVVKLKSEETENGVGTQRTAGERERLMRELHARTRPTEPFASVAKCCLLASGYPWASTIAVS